MIPFFFFFKLTIGDRVLIDMQWNDLMLTNEKKNNKENKGYFFPAM